MGINCEINLYKPPDGVYAPGETVSGVIKYSIDEETAFKKITVSLKGHGWLSLEDKFRKRNNQPSTYRNKESYVDVDSEIYQNEKGETLPIGSYESQFNFKLPLLIPSSLKYMKNSVKCTVWCEIQYYIRIKFERPGLLSFDKHYKKKITVVSRVTPRLPMEPTTYGEQKSLLQLSSLFSSKKSIVEIKATIGKSVIKPGDTLNVNYEVNNQANTTIKGVEIKLIQVDKYKAAGHHEIIAAEDVKGIDVKYGAIDSGKSQTYTDEIKTPVDIASIDHSVMISRDYAVKITAVLPLPHRNAILELPVQVSETLDGIDVENATEATESMTAAAPPSYWEVMGEEKKDKSDFGFDEDNEKS